MRNLVRQWFTRQSISVFIKQSGSCTSLQRIQHSCSRHDAAGGGFAVGKLKSSVSISCFTPSNDSPNRFNHHCNIYKMAVTGEVNNGGQEIRKCLMQACKKRDNVGKDGKQARRKHSFRVLLSGRKEHIIVTGKYAKRFCVKKFEWN